METMKQSTIQPCHRVLAEKHTETFRHQEVTLWSITTVQEGVNHEINGLARQYAADLAPSLQKGEHLSVTIRHSRTGLRWMSFLVQARIDLAGQLKRQSFESRTYDMLSGRLIALEDLFEEESHGWEVLSSAVEAQIRAYFPQEAVEEARMQELSSKACLRRTPFTLHGMSLVLHYNGQAVYPSHATLLEVAVMYPAIRPFMTHDGQQETDNLAYYKTCALTFDDGPSPENTPVLLDHLLEAGERATFMLIGEQIERRIDLVQREHDEGHSRGCHNWTHEDPEQLSPETLRSMPAKCSNALIKAIGLPPKFNRAPYGHFAPMIAAQVGWPLIQWSTDTYDWSGNPTTETVAKLKREIGDGRIILCHDTMPNTPETARQGISYLQEQGYLLLTIDELFAKDGVPLQPDVVHYQCLHGKIDNPW